MYSSWHRIPRKTWHICQGYGLRILVGAYDVGYTHFTKSNEVTQICKNDEEIEYSMGLWEDNWKNKEICISLKIFLNILSALLKLLYFPLLVTGLAYRFGSEYPRISNSILKYKSVLFEYYGVTLNIVEI